MNLDTDSTDDFSGDFTDLTNVPANLDTDSTDDFSGDFTDLTNVPVNLDTDSTDDFDGDWTSLANRPAGLDDGDDDTQLTDAQVAMAVNSEFPNLDTDATDDFSGDFYDLTNVPANLDTDSTDDFDGDWTSLANRPAGLDDGDNDTQLTETEVDAFVSNNGYLTTEVDGDASNESLTSAVLTGTNLVLTESGTDTTVDLSDLQLTGTSGSVFYAGTDGKPTENNGHLFWDGTNNRLGIGTNSGLTNKLTINGTTRTSGLNNSDGTAGLPSYRFSGDSNTGMYRSAADELAFSVGGSQELQITTSSVLVNGATTFNNHPLVIRANGVDVLAFQDNTGSPKWHWNLLSGGLNFVESGVADYRLFLENGGQVGVNTNTPSEQLDVNGNARIRTLSTAANTDDILAADATGVLQRSKINYGGRWTNTNTTTNLNVNNTVAPLFGTEDYKDDGTNLYQVSGNTLIVKESGRYDIRANLSLYSSSARANTNARIAVNGTAVGALAASGYIRSASGHNQSSIHISEILNLNANDVVTIVTYREANSGTVRFNGSGESSFVINKLR